MTGRKKERVAGPNPLCTSPFLFPFSLPLLKPFSPCHLLHPGQEWPEGKKTGERLSTTSANTFNNPATFYNYFFLFFPSPLSSLTSCFFFSQYQFHCHLRPGARSTFQPYIPISLTHIPSTRRNIFLLFQLELETLNRFKKKKLASTVRIVKLRRKRERIRSYTNKLMMMHQDLSDKKDIN